MVKFAALLLLWVGISSISLAQQGGGRQQGGQSGLRSEVTVTGQILDADELFPLTGAHLSFTLKRDTSMVFFTSADIEGRFSLILPGGRYKVQASYVGYHTLVLDDDEAVRLSSDHNDLGALKLTRGALLDEVEVSALRPSAILRGDTLDYDARAFQVNPDASAEDLIRRMPGITVDDGTVTAQGETVRRVLVDGREFFGEDPSIALRNLPAEVIERVEVYDRMSDQAELTGFDDGQRSKTINIVTRLDMRSGQFGRLYTGYGGDDRYQVGGSTNIFMDNTRISIIGMSNNVNEQNFSREDIISLAGGAIRGGTGGGAGRGMGRAAQGGSSAGHVSDFRIASQHGDNTTHALGLNYSDAWLNDRLKLSSSYFFNLSDNFTDQLTDREYFLDETNSQYYLENSESTAKNNNHRFNLRLTYDINDKNSLIFAPRITTQSNNADSYVRTQNFLAGNNLLSLSNTAFDSDLSGYSYGGSFTYRYKFDKTGRTLSTNLNANFNNNQSLYYLDALSDYFAGVGDPVYGEQALSDYLNQQSDSETINNTLSTNLTYTEPLGASGLLQFGYHISHSGNETERLTHSWNPEEASYIDFEAALSNRLKSNYLTQRGSVGYRLQIDQVHITLELGYQHALLTSEHEFPRVYSIDRSFNNLLPSAMLTYNIESGKSLRFSYRTSTNPPSVNQLQDVINNSNPILLTSGNPDLDHGYSHFFMSRYNATNTEKSTNFMAFLFGNISTEYIGNSTIIARQDTLLENGLLLNKGSQFSQPVNLTGFANIRAQANYGFPLRFIKSNLNLIGGQAWVRTPSLVNGQTNIANTFTSTGGVNLSSNISPNVDFSLSYNANYNIVEHSLQQHLDNNYFSQISGAQFSFIFFNNWVFRSDISHLMYRGLGEDFNQDYMLWNMNMGRKLFNNNLGEITLSVFDLLNQNNNIIRNVSDAYIEDLMTNQLTRFFMLSFTYNLRNFRVR